MEGKTDGLGIRRDKELQGYGWGKGEKIVEKRKRGGREASLTWPPLHKNPRSATAHKSIENDAVVHLSCMRLRV